MTLLNYAALAGALLTLVLLFVRPRWGFLALILMFPFLTYATPRVGKGLNAETVLFGVAVISVLARYRPALPVNQVLLPFVAYGICLSLGFALLASWYDPMFHGSGRSVYYQITFLKSYTWPILMFFIAFAMANDDSTRRSALACIGFAVFWGAMSGILGGNSAPKAVADFAESDRATGALFSNPNDLGGFLGCFLVIPLMEVVRRDRKFIVRVAFGCIYLVGAAALILTKSRGGWLAFLVVHAVWLFFWNRRWLIPVGVSVFLVVTTAYSMSLLPAALSERIEQTLTPSGSYYRSSSITGKIDSSAAKRLVHYQMGWEMFRDRPITGHGFLGFRFLDREYGPKFGIFRRPGQSGVDPESMYLQIMVDHGLIGVVVAAWMAWMLMSRGWGLLRINGDDYWVGLGFVSVFAGMAVFSFTQAVFYDVREASIPFWTLAGLMIRASYDHRSIRAPLIAVRRSAAERSTEPVPAP